MPSLPHELLVALFQARPSLALDFSREVGGGQLPEGVRAEDSTAVITDAPPSEYRPDCVIRLIDPSGRTVGAKIVEVQLGIDQDKRYSWPFHVTGVRAKLKCPVELLIITLDPKVARWCSRPIDLGFGTGTLCPTVVHPDVIPMVTSLEEARKCPELAVLSVVAHATRDEVLPIAAATLAATLGPDRSLYALYSDLVFAVLRKSAPEALAELMDEKKYTFKSEFARKYAAMGRVSALRDVLAALLEQRFGALSNDIRTRIDEADEDALQTWIARVIDADSPEAVLSSKA